MARCLDYLETRPADFRADKIAFQGISSGALISPLFGALETRLRAMVAIGGGIWSSGGQLIPGFAELDMVNFLPRVKLPFLLVNGRYDLYFPAETNLKAFMGLLGTPQKDKYLNLYETGHTATSPKSFKDILDFLDKYLGPVQ
jgi:dienelactone hydrolase